MAKPSSSNRSIRLTDAMWAWLNEEAERRQDSVNGVVAELLGEVRRAVGAEAQGRGPRAAVEAAKVSIPLAGTFERKPYQKGGKRG